MCIRDSGVGVVGEAAGEEVVETSVSCLHAEQVLQVVDESFPRIIHLQGLGGPIEELLEPRFEGGHEQVQACRKVAIQGADGYAGFACGLLQGRIHAVRGEFALCRCDELAAALSGIAARRPPHLLNVARAHTPNFTKDAEGSLRLSAARESRRGRLTTAPSASSTVDAGVVLGLDVVDFADSVRDRATPALI